MKDEYGNLQVYLVEPARVDYDVSHPATCEKDTLTNINERVFRTYYTCCIRGVMAIKIQLNRMKAEMFAKYNELKFVTEDELHDIMLRKRVV